MKENVIFNFFDGDKTMSALCGYFNLNKNETERYLIKRKMQGLLDQNTCFDFIKHFDLPVDKLNTANVFITAKHITTVPDNGSALQKYGLLNLKDALEKSTPLKQFLETKGIVFDINGKKVKISGMELDLFKCNGICNPCNIDRNKCSKLSSKYKEAINLLYIKLYLHKSETEVFLCGKDEKLTKYAYVVIHPEILYNIDNLLSAIQTPLHLSKQWAELQNNRYYILEFDVNIEALEYIPEYIYDEKPSYDVFEKYFDFLGYTENHFISNLIPNRFYINIFLVKNSIDIFFDGMGQEYGQIFPKTIIPYKDLRIFPKSIL